MPSPGLNVGVVFGGRSVEHDVSIITGLQACEVLEARHRPVPLYIDRHGRWFSGDSLRRVETYRADTLDAEPVVLDLGAGVLRSAVRSPGRDPGLNPSGGPGSDPAGAVLQTRRRGGLLGGARSRVTRQMPTTAVGPEAVAAAPAERRLDVIIPATHGTQGEDGALQGALELADIPYGGPTLESAVLAMNKAVTKSMLRAAGIPVVDDIALRRSDYEREGADSIVARIKARFGLPVYVKPASLGSSVGVTRCADDAELADALQLAFELDRLALVEPAVEGGKEINCAVLGRPGAELRVSVCEQPLASAGGFLSYEDKYLRGGKDAEAGAKHADAGGLKTEGMAATDRIIPAPISDELTAKVQELAKATFTAIGATGVARVDMLLDAEDRLFVNEPNTIPGSFSFYLWEPAGLSFPDLLDALIDIALAEHRDQQQTTRTFESNLLAMRGKAGTA